MKEKRSLFNTIFGKSQQKEEGYSMYQLLNTYQNNQSLFDGNAWDVDTVRSSVNAFARQVAKAKAKHVRGSTTGTSNVEKLLQQKPNKYMDAYSFLYKIAANYKMTNNAFIYPEYVDGKLVALWPIKSSSVQLVEKEDILFCKFVFSTGKTKVIPYEQMIHLRGFFYENDIFGSNNDALKPILETAETVNKSISAFAKTINSIRGILEALTGNKDEDLAKKRDEFVENNFKINSNGSGIIVTNNKMKYTPINETTLPVPNAQLLFVKNAIYSYFGVNDKIVQNSYNEDDFTAYYEGDIEPFLIQLSLVCTNCLFTDNEKNFGNMIVFESDRIQYASVKSKIAVVQTLTPIKAMKVNEVRDIFNMAPVEGGDVFLQSLNYVNGDKVDKYQDVDGEGGATDDTKKGNTSNE